MKQVYKIIIALIFICSINSISAQTPPPPNGGGQPDGGNTPVGGGAPIDGGLSILISIGLAYGATKVSFDRKSNPA